MPFVQGKCENCGGILTVDPSLKAANCPFCGVAYVVQDSINYYNTTIKVDTLHADVVNVSDESSSEARLKAAEAYMKIDKYDKAEMEYKKVTELTPQNYRGWLGLIEAQTHNYTIRIRSKKEIDKYEDYAKTVLAFAPDNSEMLLLERFRKYINSEIEKNKSDINVLNDEVNKCNSELRNLEDEKHSLVDALVQKQSRISELEKRINAYKCDYKPTIFWVTGACLTTAGVLMIILAIFVAVIKRFSSLPPAFSFGLLIALIGGVLLFLAIKGTKKYLRNKNVYKNLCQERIELDNRIYSLTTQVNDLNSICNNNYELLKKYN